MIEHLIHATSCPLQHASHLVLKRASMWSHAPWACWILLRNLSITISWYHGWHHFMYVRRSVPVEEKFNPDFEVGYQFLRDVRYSIAGASVVSAYEVFDVLSPRCLLQAGFVFVCSCWFMMCGACVGNSLNSFSL